MGTEEEKKEAESKKKLGGLLSWPPSEDAPRHEFAEWIGKLYGVTVTTAERWGTTGDTPLTLFLADGREVRWDEQREMGTPAGLQAPLIRLCIKPRPLTPNSAALVTWAITKLAVIRADGNAKDEAIGWGESYFDERPERYVSRSNEALWRAALVQWQEIDDYDPKGPRRAKSDRPFVLIDGDTGERYIRRGDFGGHVRARSRGGMSWAKIAGRMAEVKWAKDRPQYRATDSGAPYVGARVFVASKVWPDDVGE